MALSGAGAVASTAGRNRRRVSSAGKPNYSADVSRFALAAAHKFSGVAQQRLEAVIHVRLDMAMEQRQPGLVGREVDAGASVGRHDNSVFDNPRRRFAINLGDLELVAMQM